MLSLSSSLINGTHACIFVDNYFAFPNLVMKLLDETDSIGVAIFYPHSLDKDMEMGKDTV